MRTVRSPCATTAAASEAWRSGNTMERRSSQPNSADSATTTSTATALIHCARDASAIMLSPAFREDCSDAASNWSMDRRYWVNAAACSCSSFWLMILASRAFCTSASRSTAYFWRSAWACAHRGLALSLEDALVSASSMRFRIASSAAIWLRISATKGNTSDDNVARNAIWPI